MSYDKELIIHKLLRWEHYLNNYRLKQAVQLLMNSDKKVYEIADEVGFSDSAYFSKKFREVYGISPNSYKSGSGS